MWEIIKNIKFVVGLISTLMILLSAFRYEVIQDDPDDDFKDDQSTTTTTPSINIDKSILDALAKFDRNVRHLQIKGKEASKFDFLNTVPDLKNAIDAASKVVHELRKLNLKGCANNRKGYQKEDWSEKKKRGANKKTLSFSFRFGSKLYRISLYWPKLLRLFLNDDVD